MSHDALAAVDQYLAAHRTEGLDGLRAFLSIPSVSAITFHREDVWRAAAFLADRLTTAGLEGVAVLPTPGHPVVVGEWLHAPGAPTALVYGHYDVQPVDPLPLWTSPPFEPAVREGRLFARGAADDKGQVWMHILAVEALLRTTGRLPCNVKFLLEGEEEIGSGHLPTFVAERRGQLAADVVVISDSGFYAPGLPSIAYGLRGLCGLDLHVHGPNRDLHSGEYGGAVQNPLHALADLLAGLHDREGLVTVAGFYDEVRPLDGPERAALARLPFEETEYRRGIGVPATFGEAGYTTTERSSARPTLEVNGMWGGFLGEGSKTIIPAEAHAKVTCRLVPDQDADRVLALVRTHLEAHCPPGVRVEVDVHGGSPATVVPLDSEYIRAAARALQQAFGTAPVYLRMGGSIGVVPAFTQTLRAPVVLMGFGLPEDRIHSPNESFDLGNYDRGQRAIAGYWLELGAMGGPATTPTTVTPRRKPLA